MDVLAETDWDVASAGFVFLFGAVVCLSLPFSRQNTTVTLYFWHTLFCIYYALFSLSNPADSIGYFRRSFTLERPFSLGTASVDYFTSLMTQGLGLSYLGAFLAFNIIGVIGLLAYAGALQETLAYKSRKIWRLGILLVFLPGVSFWSVAIGKDALAFFGTGLLCWGTLNIKRRWIAILLALLAYTMVRPHIVAVILAAYMFAAVLTGGLSINRKIVLCLVLSIPSGLAIQFAMSVIGLGYDDTLNNVNEFIEYRQSVNLQGGSSIDIANMNIMFRMFLYAFGPIFIGTGGMLGLIASFENLILFGCILCSALYLGKQSTLASSAKWFYLLFALACWFILANTTANLGIALRQKWQFMPMLLLFALSFFPDRRWKQHGPMPKIHRPYGGRRRLHQY